MRTLTLFGKAGERKREGGKEEEKERERKETDRLNQYSKTMSL